MNAAALLKTYEYTPAHEMKLFEIALRMKKSDLSDEFVTAAIKTALHYEGIAELVELWDQETDASEQNEIIADIQEMIEACSCSEITEYSCIKFNDLEMIAKHIRQFKDSLLALVSEAGGLKMLSEKTKIPQPSLSRFFNSNAMPQRVTLLKIAKALHLTEVKIDAELAAIPVENPLKVQGSHNA
jgi:DNA-binding phage protein